MTDHEALSRLLSGDLTPDEADVLRARIAVEPALAASWANMQALASDLDALTSPEPANRLAVFTPEQRKGRLRPADPGCTPEVDSDAKAHEVGRGGREPAGETGSRPMAEAPRGRRVGWTAWIAAACVALAVGSLLVEPTHAPSGVTLLEGSHLLQGHVHALAGVVPIEVDGIARVTMEPEPGSMRGTSAEDPMNRTALIAAASAAALTVAVYEGRAALTRPDGSQLVLEAGQTTSVRGPDLQPARPAGPVARPALPPPAPPDDLPALRAENAALRERLAAAEFEGAITRGQLRSHEGTPMPWPDDAPEGLRPAAFEAALTDALAAHPDARIAALDCDEYPCVAVLSTGTPDAGKALEGVPRELVGAVAGGRPVGVTVLASNTDDPEVPSAMGFALIPAGPEGMDPDLSARSEHRTRVLLESVTGGP